MRNIKRLLYNRFFSGAILTILIWLVLLFTYPKYKAEIVDMQPSSKDYSFYYEDLDNDGNSEKLEYIRNYNNMMGIIVYKQNKTLGQWNFMGASANTESVFVEDIDDDKIKEIILFTVSNDSIFIHCLDPINRKIEFENKAICKVFKDHGNIYDYNIFPCSVYDVNSDGVNEIFWAIRSGFCTCPRNMFAYFPEQDTVYISPESCSLILNPEMFDIDGDSIPEFMGHLTHATGNCTSNRKYDDHYTWLMVFTPEMKFKFPPVVFKMHPAVTRFIPYFAGNKYYILCVHVYQGDESYPSFLALYDIHGRLIRKKDIDTPEDWVFSPVFSGDDAGKRVYLLKNNGNVMLIDTMLNMHKIVNLSGLTNMLVMKKSDIDLDGEKEYIIPGKNKDELIIYRNNFHDPVKIKLNNYDGAGQISIIKSTQKSPELFIDSTDQLFTISYDFSLFYRYRYVLIVILFLLTLFVMSIIQQLKKIRKLTINNIQKQISDLQVKSIQNQLDPHFTFNIFSSFSNLVNEKDTERANYIFDRYAGLLKASVINSEKIQISLKEELDFVGSYLELEQFRYNNKFTCTINIHDNVDKQVIIPKMIIHIFVENAIKHGLRHLHSGGKVEIIGWKDNGSVFIDITDNGIGRAKAKALGTMSTGKGLEILDRIIDYYNKLNNCKIKYSISDLFENEQAAGTRIIIQIPLKH